MTTPAAPDGPTQRLLAALDHEPGRCAVTATIARLSGLDRKDVTRRVDALRRLSLVERVRPGCFRLTEAGRRAREEAFEIKPGPKGALTQRTPRRPARQTLQDRLWRAMRQMGKFTVPDLLEVATDGESAAASAAYRMLGRLEAVGYVARLAVRAKGAALTSPGIVRWTLVPGVGPKTPCWSRKRGRLYDPNRDEFLAPIERVTIGGAS